MDVQIISAIIFVLFLAGFLFLKRKNISVQKVIYPLLYLILYRSNFGIKFMNKIAEKYRELIKFFGYVGVGLGFTGMIFISVNLIQSIYSQLAKPVTGAAVTLVLPFTNIPGVGYLSFFHWIIAIFILAIVHEFAHGIVARAHGLKIKSSGFAFFAVLAPIIPAAFVEPDEKRMPKKDSIVQYSILAAGPIVNIALALLIVLAMPYVADPRRQAPFEDKITNKIGFSFDLTNETLPVANAGLKNGTIITQFNGKTIFDSTKFLETMYYCSKPGDIVTLGDGDTTYTMTAVDDGSGRGIIGVTNFRNEVRVKPEYNGIKHIFYWFKDLFRWLFLLNFFIGLFNLLPLGIVDGGRMLNTFLQTTMKSKKKAKKIWTFISLFFLGLLLLSLLASYIMSPLRALLG